MTKEKEQNGLDLESCGTFEEVCGHYAVKKKIIEKMEKRKKRKRKKTKKDKKTKRQKEKRPREEVFPALLLITGVTENGRCLPSEEQKTYLVAVLSPHKSLH